MIPVFRGKEINELTNEELIEAAHYICELPFIFKRFITKEEIVFIDYLKPILFEKTNTKLSDIYLTYKQKYLHLQTIS